MSKTVATQQEQQGQDHVHVWEATRDPLVVQCACGRRRREVRPASGAVWGGR